MSKVTSPPTKNTKQMKTKTTLPQKQNKKENNLTNVTVMRFSVVANIRTARWP